jgi:hypothetical protein
MSTLRGLISNSGICAVSGSIAGAFVGGVFGLLQVATGYPTLTRAGFLLVAIALVLVAWLLVLVIVGVFGNYGVLTNAGQSLVTTGFTGTITALLIQATHAGLAGMLLGWLVGFAVGKLLCRMCVATEKRAS